MTDSDLGSDNAWLEQRLDNISDALNNVRYRLDMLEANAIQRNQYEWTQLNNDTATMKYDVGTLDFNVRTVQDEIRDIRADLDTQLEAIYEDIRSIAEDIA